MKDQRRDDRGLTMRLTVQTSVSLEAAAASAASGLPAGARLWQTSFTRAWEVAGRIGPGLERPGGVLTDWERRGSQGNDRFRAALSNRSGGAWGNGREGSGVLLGGRVRCTDSPVSRRGGKDR